MTLRKGKAREPGKTGLGWIGWETGSCVLKLKSPLALCSISFYHVKGLQSIYRMCIFQKKWHQSKHVLILVFCKLCEVPLCGFGSISHLCMGTSRF